MGYLLNNMNNQYDDPLNQLRHKQQISDKLKLTLLVLVLFVLIVISLSAGEIWLFPINGSLKKLVYLFGKLGFQEYWL